MDTEFSCSWCSEQASPGRLHDVIVIDRSESAGGVFRYHICNACAKRVWGLAGEQGQLQGAPPGLFQGVKMALFGRGRK